MGQPTDPPLIWALLAGILSYLLLAMLVWAVRKVPPTK